MNLEDPGSNPSWRLSVLSLILTRLLLPNLVTELMVTYKSRMSKHWLTLGNSGYPLDNSPTFAVGQPNSRYKTYSSQVTKQQKKQIGSVWDIPQPATLFCSRCINLYFKINIALFCWPLFSKNIPIFVSDFRNGKWRLSIPT